MKNDDCKTILLIDEPINENAFSQSRQQMADAICDLIESEEGGKTIGIEGSWGSGKSSIINMIKSSSRDRLVFTYDAWSHEGNVLRRTFIEEFIGFFEGYKDNLEKKADERDTRLISNLNDKLGEWEEERSSLFQRTTSQQSQTKPKIEKKDFKLFIFASALYSVGLAILIRGFSILTFNPTGTRVNYEIFFGLFALFSLFVLPKIFKYKDEKNVWAIIAQKFRSQTTATAINSPEITSRTFQEFFRTILKDYHECFKNRKLLIVFDNLDRLEKSKASSLFSTIQTFLEIPNQGDLYENIWVIIPYDRHGLENIWAVEESAGDTEENLLGKFMIEKRMSIVFHMPPIVLSDFHQYFIEQLRKAFPNDKNHDKEELERVFQLLCYFPKIDFVFLLNQKQNNSLEIIEDIQTPRQIIRLINQMGEIHRQWEYPLPDILFFVLLRKNNIIISDRLEPFLSRLDRNHYLISLLSTGYLGIIISCWFNVKTVLAYQIYLRSNIIETIDENNKTKIKEYNDNYPQYFWVTLNSLPIHTWSPGLVINSIHCLRPIIELGDIEAQHEMRTTLSKIISRLLSFDELLEIDEVQTSEVINYLLSYYPKIEFINKIINLLSYSRIFSGELESEEVLDLLHTNIKQRIQNSKKIVEHIDNKIVIDETVKIQRLKFIDSPLKEIETVSAIELFDAGNVFNLHVIIDSTNEEIDNAFGNLVKQRFFSQRHLRSLKYYLEKNFDYGMN